MNRIRTRQELLDFYRQHTSYSSAGAHSNHFKDLPQTIPALAGVLHGLIIHMWWISEDNYGLTHDDLKAAGRDILGEISLATVEQMLAKVLELDPRALDQSREPALRLVGNCRDYSLLLVSILRSRGIPARARTGVGTYFFPDELRYEDHWICEFWNEDESRWQQADAQIDELMKSATKMKFEPTDLPAGAFLTAWQCHEELSSGRAKPEQMGFGPDFNGMRYVYQKLIEDLASVTGQEVLPWASWGIGDASLQDGDEQIAKEVADLLQQIDDPATLQKARELIATHPRVRKPDGYSPGQFLEEWL